MPCFSCRQAGQSASSPRPERLQRRVAGDGASLIGDVALSGLEGVGTSKLSAHYKVLADGGARFYVSGMSAKARGLGDADIAGKPAEFAMPDVLVRLATEADVVLTY